LTEPASRLVTETFLSLVTSYWPLGAGVQAAGAAAGILAGLVGVGGGIATVPVLYGFLDPVAPTKQPIAMKTAEAISLTTVLVTAMSSARGHHRRGTADTKLLAAWGLAVFVGVIVGRLAVPILSAFGCEIRRALGMSAAIGFIVAVPGTLGLNRAGMTGSGTSAGLFRPSRPARFSRFCAADAVFPGWSADRPCHPADHPSLRFCGLCHACTAASGDELALSLDGFVAGQCPYRRIEPATKAQKQWRKV
jgi:hypothetical protein